MTTSSRRRGNFNLVIMCAERLPWQCHRYLISDYLAMRGIRVVHLVESGKSQEHRINPLARAQNGALIYDGGHQQDLEF